VSPSHRIDTAFGDQILEEKL